MIMTPLNNSRVPPGFRFHPTDEELVGYYLQKKVASKRIDLDVIHEIDLYKLEPWDLHERCKIGSAEQTEWYFFSHKDKKYPTGTRTNRATAAGFWKATGRDKAIHAKYKLIGMRKTLVFYKGRAPNGQKTDWIMHEYRLEDEISNNSNNDDGWVVCRVFKKRSSHKLFDRDLTYCYDDQIAMLPELESPSKFVTDFPYHSVVNCKQEFEAEFGNSAHDPFSHQLPQLESPRNLTNTVHLPSFKGLLTPPHQLHPTSFSLPQPHFDPAAAAADHQQLKLLVHPQQNAGQQPVTDWRLVDRIVAAQLSHEGDTAKERFSDSLPAAGDHQGVSDHSEDDVALLLRLSKQQNDYSSSSNNNNNNNNSSSSDGDLWSFHGAGPR